MRRVHGSRPGDRDSAQRRFQRRAAGGHRLLRDHDAQRAAQSTAVALPASGAEALESARADRGAGHAHSLRRGCALSASTFRSETARTARKRRARCSCAPERSIRRSCCSCPASGRRRLLRRHGIPVVLDMPGVGEDLQDHFYVRTIWKVRRPITLNDDMAESDSAESESGCTTYCGDAAARPSARAMPVRSCARGLS